jgi:hypothetical protein
MEITMNSRDEGGVGGLVIMGVLTLFPGLRKLLGFLALSLLLAGICVWGYTGTGQLFNQGLQEIRLIGIVLILSSIAVGAFWVGSHLVGIVGDRLANKFSDDDEHDE